MEVKGVDVGGVFNFIRHKPSDSEHTKEKKLWMNRFDQGMCPHCGQKLCRIKRVVFQKRFVPLNIPGKVDNGVCIHPNCDPPRRANPPRPKLENETTNNNDDSTDDLTMTTDVDSVLDILQEHRRDMAKFYQDMMEQQKKGNKEQQDTAALMLEDAMMQVNRSMAELNTRQKAQLGRVEGELRDEIGAAKTALQTLNGRVGHLEDVTGTIVRQLKNLRRESERERAEFRRQVEVLQEGLGQAKVGSNRQRTQLQSEIESLSSRVDEFERENTDLREENKHLRGRLASSLREQQLLMKQVKELQCQLDPTSSSTSPSSSRSGSSAESAKSPSAPQGFAFRGLFGRGKKTSDDSNKHLDMLQDFPQNYRFKCQQMLNEASDEVLACSVIDREGQQWASASASTLYIYTKPSRGPYIRQQQLNHHKGTINCLAVAQDDSSKTIVTGSDDTTLAVWQQTLSKNGSGGGEYKHLQTLKGGHKDSVYACAISSNGTTLVSGGKGGSVIVWKRPSSGRNATFSVDQKLLQGGLECCAMSRDGRLIATGSSDMTVTVWEQRGNGYHQKQVLKRHGDGILCCAFDECGTILVSGSRDNTLVIWSLQKDGSSFQFAQTLKDQHKEWINSCILCNSGKMLVSGSDDGSVIVWTRREQQGDDDERVRFERQQILKKSGTSSFVHCCAATEDGQTIWSGASDSKLKVWQLVATAAAQK